MTIPIDIIVGGSGISLLAAVTYFLKKTHDKIEGTAIAVTTLGRNVEEQIDKLESKMETETKNTQKEIIQVFQDICHERQGACTRLRDALLLSVENRAKAACIKIEKVAEDRERRWEKQEIINDKIKRVLYATKDGGKSWQLKDDRENG